MMSRFARESQEPNLWKKVSLTRSLDFHASIICYWLPLRGWSTVRFIPSSPRFTLGVYLFIDVIFYTFAHGTVFRHILCIYSPFVTHHGISSCKHNFGPQNTGTDTTRYYLKRYRTLKKRYENVWDGHGSQRSSINVRICMLETQKTQKNKNKLGVSPIQAKWYLTFARNSRLRLSPFLTPPGTHFQTLATGKPALLQEISCHCRPPSIPFVTTLPARFHQQWL